MNTLYFPICGSSLNGSSLGQQLLKKMSSLFTQVRFISRRLKKKTTNPSTLLTDQLLLGTAGGQPKRRVFLGQNRKYRLNVGGVDTTQDNAS